MDQIKLFCDNYIRINNANESLEYLKRYFKYLNNDEINNLHLSIENYILDLNGYVDDIIDIIDNDIIELHADDIVKNFIYLGIKLLTDRYDILYVPD